MVNGYVGTGAHWRVLRVGVGPSGRFGLWQVYRRHWDHWESVGLPHLSQHGAMTSAHRLARLAHA